MQDRQYGVTGMRMVTSPTAEPLTLLETKQHLRVTTDDEDDLIRGLIAAARRYYERVTERQMVTATWEFLAGCFPFYAPGMEYWPSGFVLPRSPLVSVDSIKYLDQDGQDLTLSPSIYEVDTSIEHGLVRLAYGKSWPSSARAWPGSIRIQFVAGYGNAAQVPEEHKAAMKLLIGNLYEHREAVGSGTIFPEIPHGLEALIWSNKVPRAA